MSPKRDRNGAALVGLAILVTIMVIGSVAVINWVKKAGIRPPQLATQGCVATSGGQSAFFGTQQMHWASIIVAESMRRNLPPRAATIAIATAMQESSLKNIDYGDRDSVGLFQQRPSQGWGTVEQIMDPWYSSGKFYEVLVKVKDWQTGDVNDVAQKVQRSGHPEAYRKHVEDAKVLASVLTGHSGSGLTCVQRDAAFITKSRTTEVITKGLKGKATVKATEPKTLTITGTNTSNLWAAVNLAMAAQADLGLGSIDVGGQKWTHDPKSRAEWSGQALPDTKKATFTLP